MYLRFFNADDSQYDIMYNINFEADDTLMDRVDSAIKMQNISMSSPTASKQLEKMKARVLFGDDLPQDVASTIEEEIEQANLSVADATITSEEENLENV